MSKRQLCVECYEKAAAATEQKMSDDRESVDIQRAVYDGMQDLRTKKPK